MSMAEELKPHKVTKPIQLLAAWLLGLILIDGSFLTAAKALSTPTWLPAVLVLAAVCNVPLFLACIFLLQTRFRPQMQEDIFYARYLRIQQETGKAHHSRNEIAELRRATAAYQEQVTVGLTTLDANIVELRNRFADSPSDRSPAVEGALIKSEEALSEVWSGVRRTGHLIDVNDLLPAYQEVRRILAEARINVTGTFGSTSKDPRPPTYSVIAYGSGVSGPAMLEICELLKDRADWYVAVAPDPINAGRVYIGSYGYGGDPVARIDDTVLTLMATANFSFAVLNDWLLSHAIYLNADFAQDTLDDR